MRLDTLKEDALLNGHWYYTIEVREGVFTPGLGHGNLAVTRRLLRNIDVRDARCLDIGTQEAVIPILLKKAGAGKVAAYDRFDLSAKVEWLRRLYGVEFDYYPGRQLTELPAALDAQDDRFFDLVVCSGVFYHLINPLGLLALARGLCRVGGLFLIETVAINDPEPKLVFNAGGSLYGPGSNYFVPTTAWLDYTLRMLGLRPLEAAYIGDAGQLMRLGLLCRSEAAPCPADPDDDWASQYFHRNIFRDESGIDWDGLLRTHSDLDYAQFDGEVISIGDRSLHQSLIDSQAYRYSDAELRLTLDAPW